jgi:hypothetical protein
MHPEELFSAPSFRDRHYVLKSSLNKSSEELWVGPARSRIDNFSATYGSAFALAIYHAGTRDHFRYGYVIPFGLIRDCFRVPFNRPLGKGNCWNANINRGVFHVTIEKRVDVSACRGDRDDVRKLLLAQNEGEIRELLARLEASASGH